MLAVLLLLPSVFFSFNDLDSLKEKVKPQLFMNKNEIIDYPIKSQYLFLKYKSYPRKQKNHFYNKSSDIRKLRIK